MPKRKREDESPEPEPKKDFKPKTRDTSLDVKPSEDDLGISLPGVVVLNSKPGGGKSHLLRYLMYMNRHRFKHGIAFSKTAFRKGNLDYIPTFEGSPEDVKEYLNFKHMVYSDQVLRAFLLGQAAYPDEERPLGFVIIDDDISDPNMFNTPAMIDLLTQYRHYNVLCVICTQYINKIATTARECASQVGLFKMDSKRSRDAAYESYGQEFEDDKEFKRWLDQATTPPEKHHFAWKDKINDKPWIVAVAPAEIPQFRIEYGKKSELGGAKKKRAKKRPRGPPPGPFLANVGLILAHTRSMEQEDARSGTKRKREDQDAEPVAQGAEDKAATGQLVPSIPKSEGGSGDKKRLRYRSRPFGVLSVHTAYERLTQCISDTFGQENRTNKEDVLKKIDELLYLAEDVSKGCDALEMLINKLDVGWQMMESTGFRVFTLQSAHSLSTEQQLSTVFDQFPTVSWLAEMGSWDLILGSIMKACKLCAEDLRHPDMPSVDFNGWKRVIKDLLKKVYQLWQEFARLKEPPPTYVTNWEEVDL